jgi:hypothetical protein
MPFIGFSLCDSTFFTQTWVLYGNLLASDTFCFVNIAIELIVVLWAIGY